MIHLVMIGVQINKNNNNKKSKLKKYTYFIKFIILF